MAKSALIFGVSGQDGAYLARLLLDKGYEVHGASRDPDNNGFAGLRGLGIFERVRMHSACPTDLSNVLRILDLTLPDEIYNLSGQSSVALSFSQPLPTIDSIMTGTVNILEAMRELKTKARFYNAGSSECFGQTEGPANEEAPFEPRSPYAIGKAAAHWAVNTYAQAWNLFACTGILFNHESPIRPRRFVTRKVAAAAAAAAAGSKERLTLGDISVRRDWGWAPEYVDAMWRILQQDEPQNFVIATGMSHSLAEFVELSYATFGLDWRDYVDFDPSLRRPHEIAVSWGDASKAERLLGWKAGYGMADVARALALAEYTAMTGGADADGEAGKNG